MWTWKIVLGVFWSYCLFSCQCHFSSVYGAWWLDACALPPWLSPCTSLFAGICKWNSLQQVKYCLWWMNNYVDAFMWACLVKKNIYIYFVVFIKCFRSTLWLLVLWGQGCLTLRGTEPEASQLKEKKIHIYTHTAVFPLYFSSCLLKISVGKSWKHSSECCHFLSSSFHQRSLKGSISHVWQKVLNYITSQQRWQV